MHILIVEDEAGIVQFLKQGLEEEGYKISTVSDGLAGFELTQKEKFDLILLDVVMPIMDGYYVCSKIKANDKTKKIPIIFLTVKIIFNLSRN